MSKNDHFCYRCDRMERWFKKEETILSEKEKLGLLIEFAKWISARSCCNICACMSCDATEVLRSIGYSNVK